MNQSLFEITDNRKIAERTYRMELVGNTFEISNPGQFVNIKMDGLFLRRPISVCDCKGENLTLIYKIVGEGTKKLSHMLPGATLDLLVGLGNGYDIRLAGNAPLLLGGGVGVPPLYLLAKTLIGEGLPVTAVLGFNREEEVFYRQEFEALGARTIVTTADGSLGLKGFVTDAMADLDYSYFYCCGPEPMLKAVYKASKTSGQFSFERRMGCGFGACMGCSCKTITGYKRICKEGPVLKKEEILWEN